MVDGEKNPQKDEHFSWDYQFTNGTWIYLGTLMTCQAEFVQVKVEFEQ
jgi:hypothetical protein